MVSYAMPPTRESATGGASMSWWLREKSVGCASPRLRDSLSSGKQLTNNLGNYWVNCAWEGKSRGTISHHIHIKWLSGITVCGSVALYGNNQGRLIVTLLGLACEVK
jgi:hypothetical protein